MAAEKKTRRIGTKYGELRSIYLPAVLAADVKAFVPRGELSGICQRALRRWVTREKVRRELAQERREVMPT